MDMRSDGDAGVAPPARESASGDRAYQRRTTAWRRFTSALVTIGR
jgi:hypothetical protein